MDAFDRSHCIALILFSGLVPQQDVERLDPRGRTPLELAVCLGHLESTRVLLRHSSDPTHCSAQGWTSESLSAEYRLCGRNKEPLSSKLYVCFSLAGGGEHRGP